MTLTHDEAASILRRLGWRIRNDADFEPAVRNFQAGWNLGTALAVDGHAGPKTSAALAKSDKLNHAGKPDASAHFSFAEVACRCDGKYPSCPRVWQKRVAFQMMEHYREHSGKPLNVVSGCRCPAHNKNVGGSPTSRHPLGLACDVYPSFSWTTVRRWRVATHIGYGKGSGKVVHIDYGAGRTVGAPAVYPDGK